jgi:hypothetical protein
VTATREESRDFWIRLHHVITWALGRLDAEDHEAALMVAEKLDNHEFRIMTRVDLSAVETRSGLLTLESTVLAGLRYVVQVEWCGGWEDLCDVTWLGLGVSEANAREELRMTLLQNGIGIPDDVADLVEPE